MFFKHADWQWTERFVNQHDLSPEDYRIFRLALELRPELVLAPVINDLLYDTLFLEVNPPNPPRADSFPLSVSTVHRQIAHPHTATPYHTLKRTYEQGPGAPTPPSQLQTGESLSAIERDLVSKLAKHRREIADIIKRIGDRPS